ncbi:TasA family protein [Brevibacillus centrosporus]|uniref:TasA family protein n=1 Tax=Brevibacillus centrosporus TaxID=54910 RepID=UPI000F09E96E|nr:TasA family protein [Brevibacillus centrosporus]MEC2128740.1 TasA family protein [Brevibacillus centrosporus]MED4910379.1 TasA family protein [Brevibacillus centrosporus]RNB71395.1 hypothetical protein EDM55_08655 [Brevibacillus centrosporus]GED30490.1 hypothetical protein BCE02nite_16310 [Brevibacillus centrosporus]
MKKKGMAIALLASTLAFAGLIGGGTYAYFSDSEQSTGNIVRAGKLSLTGFRNDVPIQGPMFYTDSNFDHNGSDDNGILGTGFWKPGDSHTRAMFIENDGDIPAKLKKVYAKPDAAQGTQAYQDAIAFANQARVSISVIQPDKDVVGFWDSDEYAEVIKDVDEMYREEYDNYINRFRALMSGMTLAELKALDLEAHGMAKEALLNHTFVLKRNGLSNISLRVKQIFDANLIDLVNNSNEVASSLQYTIDKGEALYFGYTVTLPDLTPEVNNPLQGKEVEFSFSHEFIQD